MGGDEVTHEDIRRADDGGRGRQVKQHQVIQPHLNLGRRRVRPQSVAHGVPDGGMQRGWVRGGCGWRRLRPRRGPLPARHLGGSANAPGAAREELAAKAVRGEPGKQAWAVADGGLGVEVLADCLQLARCLLGQPGSKDEVGDAFVCEDLTDERITHGGEEMPTSSTGRYVAILNVIGAKTEPIVGSVLAPKKNRLPADNRVFPRTPAVPRDFGWRRWWLVLCFLDIRYVMLGKVWRG